MKNVFILGHQYKFVLTHTFPMCEAKYLRGFSPSLMNVFTTFQSENGKQTSAFFVAEINYPRIFENIHLG